MPALRKNTRELTEKLCSSGYRVIEMWEHQFQKMKKDCSELNEFIKNHDVQDRLKPRDSFFGGRTNAIRLYYEGEAKYVDFTSLYPWVNKYCDYPVGHPEIITWDFQDVNNYFGLIKCKVLPPRGLYLLVLPYRSNQKLMFPLCRKCTDNLAQTVYQHTDEERSLIGTWVSEEVKLAIKKGYRIVKEKSNRLFRSYIDLFLKFKQESSGWPANCVSPEDKLQYIQDYKNREGIDLDPTRIEKNPGRRAVSKAFLNNFWGR
ncbi:uncharacterized protein [Parasteatoda tepidariorum]|uniref:uncharacterized protein n=1 Tax=Parasteatoda tepidariorum TaxID=114398 RepID=UPI0039BC4A38